MTAQSDEIVAGLCLSRLLRPEDAMRRAAPWLVATMAERLQLPPAGVIADIGALLFGAALERPPPASEDAGLAAAVRRYEDAVLGRLTGDRRLAAAGFAALRLPEPMHAQAIGILVAGILARVQYEGGLEAPPGVVRRLGRPEEAVAHGFVVLQDAAVRAHFAARYSALARAAQKTRALIGDADLFALENLAVLGGLAQRLAADEVVRAQEALMRGIPRRVARRRKKEGDIAAKLEDESAYPAGGFASMSTSGSIENLVTSELIYMDVNRDAKEMDLFDLRWVEGELLYFTRDEAILVRRRRIVVLALDPTLAAARVKDAHLPWQRIVLALGVVLTLTKKLVELLGEEALEIRVAFLSRDLDDERALTELLLSEWRNKGMCQVEQLSWSELTTLTSAASRTALVEVVHIGGDPLEAVDPRVIVVDYPLPTGNVDDWSKRVSETLSALL